MGFPALHEVPAVAVESLIAIIMRPLRADEGHKDGNDHKERELRCELARLTPLQALLLRRRLTADHSNDELAVAFKRLVVERRTRLLAYLADPRRGRI